jgi:EAL domain-containing protein (putative c-di-GMP-specific phosphodiesterase class I)
MAVDDTKNIEKQPKVKGKKRRQVKRFLALHHYAIIVAILIASATPSFLFLPLNTALLVMGGVVSCMLVFLEQRRRQFWEQALSFKLMDMKKKHDELLDMVNEAEPKSNYNTSFEKYKKDTPYQRTRTAGSRRYEQMVRDDDIIIDDEEAEIRGSTIIPRRAAAAKRPDSTRRPLNPKVKPAAKRAVKEQSNNEEVWALDAGAGISSDPIVQTYFSDSLIQEFITKAVETKTIGVFARPVMRIPDRTARFYELTPRIPTKTGTHLIGEQYRKIAEKTQQLTKIKRILLSDCLQIIKNSAKDDNTGYFLNVSPDLLQDGRYMQQILEFLKVNRDDAHKLVLEFSHADFEAMPDSTRKLLRGITKLGCKLSIENVQTLDLDINALMALNVRTIKMPASYLLKITNNSDGFKKAVKLRRSLEGSGIGVIVERVEKETELKALENFAPRYAQGNLFGPSQLLSALLSQQAA